MSKYNITIETMNTESLPFKATGTIGDRPITLQTIAHATGILWKTVENGQVSVPLSQSEFGRGERSAIAKFAKAVELNRDLLGKSSQTTGSTSRGPSRNSVLQQQNDELKQRLAEVEAKLAAITTVAVEAEQEEPQQEETSKRRRSKKK